MQFEVEVTYTVNGTVTVEADSKEEAASVAMNKAQENPNHRQGDEVVFEN